MITLCYAESDSVCFEAEKLISGNTFSLGWFTQSEDVTWI